VDDGGRLRKGPITKSMAKQIEEQQESKAQRPIKMLTKLTP